MSDLHISISGKPEDLEAMFKAIMEGQMVRIEANGEQPIPVTALTLACEGDSSYGRLMFDGSLL